MGKRKRATKPPPKKKSAKLETIFNCPFCQHENCVYCEIDRGTGIGEVKCRICGVTHKSSVNKLEEAIDVYANWIDACDEANKNPVETSGATTSATASKAASLSSDWKQTSSSAFDD